MGEGRIVRQCEIEKQKSNEIIDNIDGQMDKCRSLNISLISLINDPNCWSREEAIIC